MYADGLFSRSNVRAYLAIVLALAITPRAALAGGWVEFSEESPSRLIADSGVGLDDHEEKDMVVGDVDLDGDDDLVVVRKLDNASSSGPLRNVLFLNEDGVLVDHTADLIPGFMTPTTDRDVQLSDLDGDGWLDIITAQAFGGAPKIYMNQGEVDGEWQGFVYEASRIPNFPVTNFCGVAAGDIDNQNGPDLYFVSYNDDEEDRLLINDGNGFFADETSRITASSQNGAFTSSNFGTYTQIVDMNGDGMLDIMKSENGPAEIAFNDGNGFFQIMQIAYDGAAYNFTTFDLENDGDLDFYVADDGTDRYGINLGTNPNGTVNFVEHTAANSTNGFGSNILVADFNNDSFDDLMVADVDVDAPSCNGYADLLRNTGVSGSGNLIDTIPLGSLNPHGVFDQAAIDLNEDGWLDLIVGKCTGYDIFINVPPLGLVFTYPSGLPTFVVPDEALILQVQVATIGEGELDPSSPMFHLSIDGGAFEATLMTNLGDGLYEASLPATSCLTEYNFYVSAELMTGAEFLDPPDAPADSHEAIAALGTEIVFLDTIEGDVSGWEIVSDPSLMGGEWEQADPILTFHNTCGIMSPDADATNGDFHLAFVTENGEGGGPGMFDVDLGPTFLMSPVIDLSGSDGAVIYSRWFRSCLGTTDLFTVEISNDGGDNWTLVEQIGDTLPEWQVVSFQVGDFVEPTDNVRVRFSTADTQDDSLTEAGIDNFQVDAFICSDEQPCEGDANGDGTVDPLDSGYVLARFGCPVGAGDPSCDAADVNGDGAVDPLDSGFVLARFGDCS